MRRVFVDTSAFVALRNAGEREHEAARSTLRDLVAERAGLFTSNYVFSETFTALLVRVSLREALEWGRMFRAGTAVELIRIDEEVEEDAWSILERHADKRWSHVDATSFALMAREGVTEAFSLDANFAQRGLQVLPAP